VAHVRKQLRDWLKAELAGSAEAGSRVFVRRSLPLARDLQPTFLLSIENERSADMSMSGSQNRTVAVRITGCVKDDSEDGENTLDAMAVFAEGVFSADPTLGGMAETYEYQATEFAFTAQGETTLCTAALSFAVTLLTARDDPETLL